MPELAKTYNPNDIERDIYRRWEASGYFNPDKLPNAKKRKPFVISMPPPNITGELHVGHVLGFAIQDALIRYQRMRGRAALWVPGSDHAAISTQVMVERELRKEGLDRQALGREKFLRRVWQWREQYGRRIVEQTKRIGASADWSREHFTMDKDLSAAVYTAFKKLYDDGLIYRGERIVNWCPDCQTAISDLEVDHEDVPGSLWYIKYRLTDGSGQLSVATTRPETMLGDTAVAVHPQDPRYTALVGRTVRLPIVNREIPIIADERIDKDFGTGAVKVTPAHDPLDFDLGQTHHLPAIQVIGFDAKMTAAAGPDFAGLPVEEARKRVVQKLVDFGVLEKTEDYIHAVAKCSRTKTIIQPLVSLQWFVKTKQLAARALKDVRSGKITIVPKRFEKTYFHWLEHIRDWNISRQIWWGHRLPVWYKKVGEREMLKVSPTSPGPGWVQDQDTLDTWFSSGLWTFSTLGWPKRTSDLKRFHPTTVMVTGWDILFFWVARMIMFSEYFLGTVPFKTVYLHGLVLDQGGQKMSKSKGTGVDPIPTAEKYGTDALRLSLVVGNAAGQDFRLYEKKIEGYRNFANKLWNIARYVLGQERPRGPWAPGTLADHWILDRLQATISAVTKKLEVLDLSSAGQMLYDFVWHDLADWYLEAAKIRPNPGLLYAVVEETVKLLHPFMPFITEYLWGQLHPGQLLMVEAWPRGKQSWVCVPRQRQDFMAAQQTVVALRNFRVHSELPAGTPCSFVAHGDDDSTLFQTLTGITIQSVPRLTVDSRYQEILLGQTTFQIEKRYVERYEAWRQKERHALQRYIEGVEHKLANADFAAHAPAEVVAAEQEKLSVAKQRLIEL